MNLDEQKTGESRRVSTNGRRLTDDFNLRLTILENAVIELESDMRDNKAITQHISDTLDDIRQQVSTGKGFLQAGVFFSGLLFSVLSFLMYVQWLKVPV